MSSTLIKAIVFGGILVTLAINVVAPRIGVAPPPEAPAPAAPVAAPSAYGGARAPRPAAAGHALTVNVGNALFAFGIGAVVISLAMPRLATLARVEPVAVAAPVPQKSGGAASAVAWTGIDIPADSVGQYQTDVRIDGFTVPVIVDTGATFVHLTAADARRVGLLLADSDFKYKMATANGLAPVAKITLHEVQLGSIRLYDVQAVVAHDDGLWKSLLGMSFLGRLSRVEAAGGHLTLRP